VAETLPLVERHLAEVLGATETFHRTLAQIAAAEPVEATGQPITL
jgi:hypothetical protein